MDFSLLSFLVKYISETCGVSGSGLIWLPGENPFQDHHEDCQTKYEVGKVQNQPGQLKQHGDTRQEQ